MQIIHRIDDFLFTIFPEIAGGGDNLLITNVLEKYYTYGPFKPKVTLDNEWVTIDIDTSTILAQDQDYRKAISFCEKGDFVAAKPILESLTKKNPTNSEYHRILGQVLSEEGNQDDAINSLIDSLKWDPTNGYALIMMGNVFARYKDDVDTAMKYYNQALKIKPDDHIAINNIGANLLQLDKIQEGIKYLEDAYSINPKYANTSYGLCIAYGQLDYPLISFDYAIKCMKSTENLTNEMFKSSFEIATDLAKKITKDGDGFKIFEQFKSYLERKTGLPIRIEEDNTLPNAAKIEFAENYERDFHLIKFKPNYPAVEHLIMHELVHLEFANDARLENCNMLFITGKEKKVRFIKDHEKEIKKLSKQGYSEETISNFISSLYNGINNQVFNAPVDLFIEDYLFENYPELQPYQFLSLTKLINDGKDAVVDKKAVQLTPPNILSVSKILNIVNAIQFKDLYGIDILKQFQALPFEMKEAERMWAEYLDYRKDKEAGEEYEIVQHWGEDLRMEKYFDLVDENDFRNSPKTVEEVLASIESDPFGVEVDKNFKEKEMETFQKTQQEIGTNMAVVMFMVDALQYFGKMEKNEVMKIAYEIAMYGTQGFHPEKKDYVVPSMPGKVFSGYHILAYYYVSWKIAIPEMVDKLQLPFEEEYKLALSISKPK